MTEWPTTSRFHVDPLTRSALALAVVNRCCLFAVVWLGLRAIPRLPLYRDQVADSLVPGRLLLDGWTRWDAVHYARIAAHGYPNGAGVAFFPVFPLLERALVTVVGATPSTRNLAIAGIVISNLCFLVAVPLLSRLVASLLGGDVARSSVLMLVLTPFGFYFSAAYTESTFFLLTLISLSAAQSGRWRWAAVAAGVASGTRLIGLAMAPALLLRAWRQGAPVSTLASIAVLAPSGTVAFFVFCWWKLGDPLASIHAQAGWGGWDYRVRGYARLLIKDPRTLFWGDPKDLSIVLNLIAAALVLATLPWVWRMLDPATALFTTLVACQFLVTWVSLGRYLLPAIGAYVVGGYFFRRAGWPRDAAVIACATTQAVLAILFSHGYWIV